jgi:FixJ family two-component response regulator
MVIAIVDDDAGVLRALGRLLSAYGYRTELFGSAEEFLSSEAKSKAACLITDIDLGNMSGLELARQLSAEGTRLPVIFISGSRVDEYRKQVTELGCVAYLQKPIASDLLIAAIEKTIGPNR